MFLTILGSGNRLREAVRVVTDGTLNHLSRSLTGRTTAYVANSNGTVEDTKPSASAPTATTTYSTSTTAQGYTYSNSPPKNGTNNSSSYISPDDAPLHDSTPYPTATQYSTYPDSAPSIAYTPSQPPNTYTAYPSSSDPVEAPLLEAFAAQASQVHASPNPSHWRTQPNSLNSTSHSWQQWTSTMAGNLEAQDCYSANALMQLGSRELADGTSGANGQGGDAQTGVGVGQLDHGHLGTSVGMGGTWPLNIFDIGQGQAGS
jgi:hypothetical protein